jgi:hypothetical protein
MTDQEIGSGSSNGPLFDDPQAAVVWEPAPSPVRIAGRELRPTAVFNTYWRFASARQEIYLARLRRSPLPWTQDEVLRVHRFTNVFRASDRVSQFLIARVQRGPGVSTDAADVVFRTLLFKVFNREDTWSQLESTVGQVSWRTYDYYRYRDALDEAAAKGPIYSAAYVMPPPRLGEARKHANHLRLLEQMMRDGLASQVRSAPSLRAIYETLVSYPGLGPFLSFQYAIDLNYSDLVPFDEDDFVVAGPGAKDGIRKCFGKDSVGIETDVIRYMTETQEEHFTRLGLDFPGLFGRRLHLIDAQNLFCEVDKYARVRHPEIAGISGRSRIKQRYTPGAPLANPVFPRRWGIDIDGPSGPAGGALQLCVLEGCLVEVNNHSPAVVGSQVTPHLIARQDRSLQFGTG